MRDKAYSTNDEEYPHTSPDEALRQLADDGNMEVGATYYESDIELVDLASLMSAPRILENAEELLYDEVGECAEDAFTVSREAMEDLETVISAWVAKHIHGRYWRCVGKTRQLKVTAEDVAEYGGTP